MADTPPYAASLGVRLSFCIAQIGRLRVLIVAFLNMALEGTHIRFALEFKEKLGVKNVSDYVAGCLYPDSRYKTKLDRAKTHPVDYMDWSLVVADDFRKGWFTHLLCDRVQSRVFKKKFPQFFIGEIDSGNQTWVALTAVKLLEDLADVRAFPVASNLPEDASIFAACGEDRVLLNEYYGVVRETYSRPLELTIAGYRSKLSALGLGEEHATLVVARAKELSHDKNIMELIGQVYDEAVSLASEMILI